VIAFAVTYISDLPKNRCNEQCDIGTPVAICENKPQPELMEKWHSKGISVILSFGGAGMGSSIPTPDQNNCWDFCYGKEDHLVD